MTTVRAHFDGYLGEPRRRTSHSLPGRAKIEVREHPGQPEPGDVTWVTVGLASLASSRRELVFGCHERFACPEIAGLLAGVARRIVESGIPHFWGDLIDLGGPVLPGTKAEALYVSQPVFWPHGFETIPPANPTTWVAWLVPVYRSEARHIAAFGGHDFDIRIEEEDADLMDLRRRALV